MAVILKSGTVLGNLLTVKKGIKMTVKIDKTDLQKQLDQTVS